MAQKNLILIEGLTPEQIISLEELEGYAGFGRPVVFRVGKSEVLAEFSAENGVLNVEIAVVEQGGEGVLSVLIDVVERSARPRGYLAIEWSVFARNCATPNPKLEHVLERLSFEVREAEAGGEYYWRRVSVNDSLMRRH